MLRAMWYNFNSPFNVEDTGVIDCVENNFALVVEFIEIDDQFIAKTDPSIVNGMDTHL